PPLVFVAAAALLYRHEISRYNWKELTKATFWEPTLFALTQGIIAQAIGIVIVVYGFGVAQPTVGVALAPAVIISAIICSAILEETVYRGSLFGYLDRIVGMWPAAVVSSAIFAVAHYNYSAYLGYFLLGLVWCRVYKK